MFVFDPHSLTDQKITLARVFEGSELFILADYIEACPESLLYVARDEASLRQMVQDLSYFFLQKQLLPFPGKKRESPTLHKTMATSVQCHDTFSPSLLIDTKDPCRYFSKSVACNSCENFPLSEEKELPPLLNIR